MLVAPLITTTQCVFASARLFQLWKRKEEETNFSILICANRWGINIKRRLRTTCTRQVKLISISLFVYLSVFVFKCRSCAITWSSILQSRRKTYQSSSPLTPLSVFTCFSILLSWNVLSKLKSTPLNKNSSNFQLATFLVDMQWISFKLIKQIYSFKTIPNYSFSLLPSWWIWQATTDSMEHLVSGSPSKLQI